MLIQFLMEQNHSKIISRMQPIGTQHNYTHHNDTQYIQHNDFSITTLRIILSVANKSLMPGIIVLRDFILSVVMLSVVVPLAAHWLIWQKVAQIL